jgi:hypothetical protein
MGMEYSNKGFDTVVEVHFILFFKSCDSLSFWDEFQQPYSVWVLSFFSCLGTWWGNVSLHNITIAMAMMIIYRYC